MEELGRVILTSYVKMVWGGGVERRAPGLDWEHALSYIRFHTLVYSL